MIGVTGANEETLMMLVELHLEDLFAPLPTMAVMIILICLAVAMERAIRRGERVCDLAWR